MLARQVVMPFVVKLVPVTESTTPFEVVEVTKPQNTTLEETLNACIFPEVVATMETGDCGLQDVPEIVTMAPDVLLVP